MTAWLEQKQWSLNRSPPHTHRFKKRVSLKSGIEKAVKSVHFMKSTPLEFSTFWYMWPSGKNTAHVQGCGGVSRKGIWCWEDEQQASVHGISFLLERMTDRLTDYGYSDLGMWQTFFRVSLSLQGKQLTVFVAKDLNFQETFRILENVYLLLWA